jgi:alpha-galactosidase
MNDMNIVTDALAVIVDPDRQSLQISSRRNPEQFFTLHRPVIPYNATDLEKRKFVIGVTEPEPVAAELPCWGKVNEFTLADSSVDGIEFSAQYRVSDSHPIIGIQFSIRNSSMQSIQLGSIQVCSLESISTCEEGRLGSDLGCYVNGWQSWSYTGTYNARRKAIHSRLKRFQGPKLYDAATPHSDKAGVFASDQFGIIVDRSSRVGVLAGFLSQVQQYGHILMQPAKALPMQVYAAGDGATLPPGQSIATDWLILQFIDLNDPDPMKQYLDLAAGENHVHLRMEQPSGWCSWYHYFTGISPRILRDNIDELAEIKDSLPIQLIQIDDGYQKAVGDWLDVRRPFSGQMELLAADIAEKGFQPGLWLAPFIVHPSSSLWKEHPDWILRDARGKPVNAGWNWNRFCGGLDLTHPDVQSYLRDVIETVVKVWGYSYLKLDFMYAGALDGIRYDPTLTRAQVIRKGMELIREAAGPDTYLLGCGAPLGSMLGLVDGMRIGTDVAPDWEPRYFGIELLFPNEPDIPSAKNAMQNVLTRSMLHNRWWQNDPDCLLVRESSHLTLTEIQSMASLIAISGGLMLISDDMREVSRYRLRIAQVLLPVIGKRPFVLDWADELHPHLTRLDLENQTGVWHLLGYTNWENRAVKRSLHLSDFRLPSSGRWILRSFWKEKVLVSEGGSFEVNVPPHGTVLLAARMFTPDQPVYAGSNLHISQGLEVSRWECHPDALQMTLNLPTRLDGCFELFLPFAPTTAEANGQDMPFEMISTNHYRFKVAPAEKTDIRINA